MRRLRRLPINALQPILFEPPKEPMPLEWDAVFAQRGPVEIEVGFGKGLFLVNATQARPDVNFFGIEIERKYQLYVANRLAKRGVRNARLAKADARSFFRDFIPSASVQAVHVYFPDPWWKRRHHKHRVFTAEFVEQCARVLAPRGMCSVATDVAPYFEIISKLLGQHADLQCEPPLLPGDPAHDMDYLTNHERKFRREGKPIFRAIHSRRA